MIDKGALAVSQEVISYLDAAPEQAAAREEHVVILPGSGCTKSMNQAFAKDFADLGHRALCLDFSGHGESSGDFADLTLARRRDQAAALIEARVPAQRPVILVGFSMSGQTAADLIEILGERVTGIALGAPAIYPGALREVPFGDPSFLQLLSDPQTWTDSPALAALSAFRGKALLLIPEHDEQVPASMTELIEQSMRANPRFTMQVLPGADHGLDEWFGRHPTVRRTLITTLTASP
ncbi:alpha/beta hydrolase [Catenulispora subtropica]|uniref:AB hydrolase-1 domain-containing protein n=1 Tax=Catenulispora subtropica TaxID=450798 RepID=A0ABP5D5Q1_9ACTN